MNLAVAFTEYQLLQIQALVKEYELQDIRLITFDKKRIPRWLIVNDLFEEVLFLPPVVNPRWKRLTKPFIDRYFALVKQFLNNRNVKIFIGAQDENTVFALIKMLAEPEYYWSIEDGLANYYHRDITFKMGIAFKNGLFNTVYQYPVDIAYGHGKVKADKSFRMDPELCVDSGKHIAIDKFLMEFIKDKQKSYQDLNSNIRTRYGKKKKLVVSRFEMEALNRDNHVLYKFHPQDRISGHVENDFITEIIPIEVLLPVLPSINMIQFDAMSSSILNVLKLWDNISIQIRFSSDGRLWENFFSKLTTRFSDRIEFVA